MNFLLARKRNKGLDDWFAALSAIKPILASETPVGHQAPTAGDIPNRSG